MGFFSPITNAFSGAKKEVQSALGGNVPTNSYQVSPEVKALQQAQLKKAQDYRAGLAGMKEQEAQRAGIDQRQNLANSLAGVQKNASSRGLLYSGLERQGEVQAGQNAAGQAAQQIAGANQGLDQQADALDTQAIQSGLGIQGMQQGSLNDAYNQAMAARQAQMGMFGQLGGALSSVGGAAAGRR